MIYIPVVEAVGMWESRRDFQRVWEGWEAGFMAFHPFHALSFAWPAFHIADTGVIDMPLPNAMSRTHHKMLIGTWQQSLDARRTQRLASRI
jgi:hypothetical protein